MSAEQHPAGAFLAAAVKEALSRPEGRKVVEVAKLAGAAVRGLREEGERIEARGAENRARLREAGRALRELLLRGKGHG